MQKSAVIRFVILLQLLCHVISLWPHGRSMPCVLHRLPELTQTHVHWVGDAVQPSRPLSFPSPPAFSLSQHQGLFKWVSSCYHWGKLNYKCVSIWMKYLCKKYLFINIYEIFIFKKTNIGCIWEEQLSGWEKRGKENFPFSLLNFKPCEYVAVAAQLPVMSDSVRPYGLSAVRLLCPCNSPGKSTGVGCHASLQEIFPNPGIEPRSPALQEDSMHLLSHQGSPCECSTYSRNK